MSGLSTLHQIMTDVLRMSPEKIAVNCKIHDIDTWNSLTHIEFVVTIEEKFRIQLTEDEIVSMTSIDEVERILRGRGVLV